MKKFAATVAGLAMTLTSFSAMGIDLRNEDARDYTVKVKSTAMQRDVTLPARSMSLIICVGQCTFFVPGMGRVRAEGSDVVMIRNGRLETLKAPRVARDS